MDKAQVKTQKRARRHKRIRAKVHGTGMRPRLSVYKSNRYVFAQLVDDDAAKTVCAVSSKNMKGKNLRARAREVGTEIAKEAKGKKIESVVFDRGGFAYTGIIKELADGARGGGLQF